MDAAFHPYQREVEDWHWWYRMRRDLLEDLLRRYQVSGKIVDIGCGTGGNGLVLARYGQVTGVDREAQALQLAADRPYLQRVQHSLEGPLPFSDGAFDAAVALDVIEHLDDDAACARELKRIVRPGGTIIVFVPAFQLLWGYNDEFSHHRRRYTRDSLNTVLQQNGLNVIEAGYFNAALFPPTLAARLLQRAFPARTQGMEHQQKPGALNHLLTQICRAERPLFNLLRGLPVGTSAYAVARA